jgi:hypothetical protein
MGFTTVTELPLVLHSVEHDPFLDSTWGEVRSGAGELTTGPLHELAVSADELRVRSRHAELAA